MLLNESRRLVFHNRLRLIRIHVLHVDVKSIVNFACTFLHVSMLVSARSLKVIREQATSLSLHFSSGGRPTHCRQRAPRTIVQPYLPGGAYVHAFLIRDTHLLSQTALDRFSRFCIADAAFSLYVIHRTTAFSPTFTPFSLEKSSAWFLGRTPPTYSNGTSFESAVFFTIYACYQTDRQNEHGTRPVRTDYCRQAAYAVEQRGHDNNRQSNHLYVLY